MRFATAATLATLCLSTAVTAHSVVTEVNGANGVKSAGMGVTDPTGKKPSLFDQASRYATNDKSLCGAQKLDGKKLTQINKKAEIDRLVKKGLPTPDKNGILKMTMFQINGDGAGPYKCEVTTNDKKKNLVPVKVTKDVPGTNGKDTTKNKAFDFEVQVPPNLKCTGPGNSCILRCKNAIKQPFGGCVVFKAAEDKKRSLFGRLAIGDDEEDVETDEVSSFDDETDDDETLDRRDDAESLDDEETLDDADDEETLDRRDDVESLDDEETLDRRGDEAEEPTSENLDELD